MRRNGSSPVPLMTTTKLTTFDNQEMSSSNPQMLPSQQIEPCGGVLAGGTGRSPGATVAGGMVGKNQQSRIVSATSSIVSATSLSTKSLSTVSEGWSSSMSGSSDNSRAPIEEKKENAVFREEQVPTIQPQNSAHVAPTLPTAPAPSTLGVDGGNAMVLQMGAPPHPVAEFLFQLTKMLTDDNSRYIEWRNASIFVHDPPGLEKDILPKYFRHSNYSSFQRQMNYFGFRKIAGKGKMAPCSYVNENAKEDIASLLFIKRKKTGVSSAAAKLLAQQNRINRTLGGLGVNSLGGNSLMGGSGAAASLQPDFSITMGGYPSVGAGAGSLAAPTAGALDEAAIYQNQQNMLAQLQQAHASAMNSSPVHNHGVQGGGIPQACSGGIPQASQNKFDVGWGSMSNVAANAGFLTNDQGNIYSPNAPADAAAQSLLIQQVAGGNFSQGLSTAAGAGDANNFARIDSAANLRALINQQISMFNTSPTEAPFATTMNHLSAPLPAGIVQHSHSPRLASQEVGRNPIMGNASQGISQDWNDMLQRIGGGGGGTDNAATAAALQLEQQLLQSNGGPSPGHSFNLNGLFNPSGGASGY